MSLATNEPNGWVAQTLNNTIHSCLNRETQAFLKSLNAQGKPLELLSPQEAGQVLAAAQTSVEVDLSGVEVTPKTITYGKYTVPLHVVRPAGVPGDLGVFLFIHGGWVPGGFPIHQRMVRDLVVLSGCTAVFVDYTRTPEAWFPQAVNEVYAAAQWVRYHCQEIGVDHRRMAIVGSSVGGSMSAVITMMAKEKKRPDFKLQMLLWPMAEADCEHASYHQIGKSGFLTPPPKQQTKGRYMPDPSTRKPIPASPLRAPLELLRGLPPTLIVVAENDVLREEGEVYGRKLDEAGVPVTTIRYNGMMHDFGLLNALAYLPQTRSMLGHAAAELKKYLCPNTTAGQR